MSALRGENQAGESLLKKPLIEKYVVDVNLDSQSFTGFKFCKKCKDLKPPRAHHCSACNECVMRMDHHCVFTGNCIGLDNHKYFLCLCFWNIVAGMHVVYSSYLMNPYLSPDPKLVDPKFIEEHPILNPLRALDFAFSVPIGVGLLLALHLFLLARNETSLECGEFWVFGGNSFRQPSAFANIAQILGPDIRYWVLPVLPKRQSRNKDGKMISNPYFLDGVLWHN